MEVVCKIGRIISAAAVFLLIALALAIIVPRLFGVRVYSVESGSMSPALGIGDLIYVAPAVFSDLRQGDIVTYVLNENLTLVTHRIVETDSNAKALYTKGDANTIRDAAPVSYENIVGVVRFSLPWLGFLIGGRTGNTVRIAAVLVIGIIFLMPTAGRKLNRGASGHTAKP